MRILNEGPRYVIAIKWEVLDRGSTFVQLIFQNKDEVTEQQVNEGLATSTQTFHICTEEFGNESVLKTRIQNDYTQVSV